MSLDPRKSLSGILKGATDVQYETRGDTLGVRITRQDEDEEEWIPVVVKMVVRSLTLST